MTTQPPPTTPAAETQALAEFPGAAVLAQAEDEAKEAKVDFGELKRMSIRGGAVTLASQAVSTVVYVASTVILARMLTPADYGIVAMVTAITSFAGLFRDLGLSSAAIQTKDLTTGQQTNLFWLNVAMGAALTILVAICSPLVSWFYGRPELTTVTAALSLNFVLGSFGAQHGAMLVRNMQFGRKAIAGIAGGVLSLVVAVSMAYHGFSYWALVASSLTGTAVGTTLLFLLSPFWPGLPGRRRGISQMLAFGAHVTAFDFINYFHRNLDNVLIGRFSGTEALGLYSHAYALIVFPLYAIRGPISTIAFPAMSKLLGDPQGFASYARNIMYVTGMLSMPAVSFLYFFSDAIIDLVLGEKWAGVSSIFSVLALAGFIQPVCGIRGVVLHATGNGGRLVRWGLVNSIVTSLAFAIGINWGPLGIACAYCVTNYALLVPSLHYIFQDTPLSLSDFFKPLAMPVVFSLGAGIVAFLLTEAKGFGSSYERVAFGGSLYVVVFSSLVLATSRGRQAVVGVAASLRRASFT